MVTENLIKILQASIAPFVLISGIGLLVLSMTNRLARPIDRIRLLCTQVHTSDGREQPRVQEQIRILYKRCQMLQIAIALATCSIFFISSIVLMLFSMFTFHVHWEIFVESFFIMSLFCLMSSLILFLQDIRMTLNSVKIEMSHCMPQRRTS